jgi:hypothetical protein
VSDVTTCPGCGAYHPRCFCEPPPPPRDTSNEAIVAMLDGIVERLARIEKLADEQEYRRKQAIRDANEW